jgi:hypothetical protein
VFSFKQNPADNKTFLKEVWVASHSLKQARRIITKEISYGSGKENVGAFRGGEGANMGPASFTADSKGKIYICDTVNKRIQILSPEGKFLSSITLNAEPDDIASDKNGLLYVFAGGNLYRYDSSGNLTSEIPIDPTRWQSMGPIHIVDDGVYARADGRGDLLIAHIENGKLAFPSAQELREPLQEGFVGRGGKRYMAFPKDIEGAAMEVIERDGTKSPRFLPFKILSLVFLGEDQEGNTYMQTEANNDDGISLSVSRFDANGNYLDTIPIPGNNYDFWALKMTAVGDDGTIYQMMPTKDRLILNSFLAN